MEWWCGTEWWWGGVECGRDVQSALTSGCRQQIPMQSRNGPWTRSRDPNLQRVACSWINSAKSSDVPPQIDSGLCRLSSPCLIITQTLVRSAEAIRTANQSRECKNKRPLRRYLAEANAAPADARHRRNSEMCTATAGQRAAEIPPAVRQVEDSKKGAAPGTLDSQSLPIYIVGQHSSPLAATSQPYARGAGSRVGMIGFRRL